MKFDGDLIEEVKMQALPGVEFEDHEVTAALTRAVNGYLALVVFPTAVQRAALKVVAARRAAVSVESGTS